MTETLLEDLHDIVQVQVIIDDSFGEYSVVIEAPSEGPNSKELRLHTPDATLRDVLLDKLLQELVELTGAKLASELTEEEARRLYLETLW